MCGEGRQEKASEGKVKEGAAVIGHHENTADVALHLGWEPMAREAMEAQNCVGETGPAAL